MFLRPREYSGIWVSADMMLYGITTDTPIVHIQPDPM